MMIKVKYLILFITILLVLPMKDTICDSMCRNDMKIIDKRIILIF